MPLASRAYVKADGRINGVETVTKDPKGPDLKYQTSSQHSDNQSNPHDDLTTGDYQDTWITMAFSMHYNTSGCANYRQRPHLVEIRLS
jgi:hypothetical protein